MTDLGLRMIMGHVFCLLKHRAWLILFLLSVHDSSLAVAP